MVRPKMDPNVTLSQVTLSLDREVMEAFAATLPRNMSVSEALRDYMSSKVDEAEQRPGQSRLRDNFPDWMIDYKNWQVQNQIQDSMSRKDRVKAVTILAYAHKRWMTRNLPPNERRIHLEDEE